MCLWYNYGRLVAIDSYNDKKNRLLVSDISPLDFTGFCEGVIQYCRTEFDSCRVLVLKSIRFF